MYSVYLISAAGPTSSCRTNYLVNNVHVYRICQTAPAELLIAMVIRILAESCILYTGSAARRLPSSPSPVGIGYSVYGIRPARDERTQIHLVKAIVFRICDPASNQFRDGPCWPRSYIQYMGSPLRARQNVQACPPRPGHPRTHGTSRKKLFLFKVG